MYGHVITKFSRMGRLLHFLTHVAPLARFARKSSAMNHCKKINLSLQSFETGNLSADYFKKYSSSMGRHLGPRYGQVILVNGYPVLTSVN